MTEAQKKQIIGLRREGRDISDIAAIVGESKSTVRQFCYRHKKEIETVIVFLHGFCQNCGAAITQVPKQKPKKFCCVQCREAWWNANRKQFNTNMKISNCAYCGKPFEKFERSTQRFCSHQHYILSRFGEVKADVHKSRAVSK